MKKFILVVITLLTFCGAVAYGDDCDVAIRLVQQSYDRLNACANSCSSWGKAQGMCIALKCSWLLPDYVQALAHCKLVCSLAHKSPDVCQSNMQAPASLSPTGKAAYDRLMRDAREKVRAAVAKQEAAAKNGQNKCQTCPTNNQNSR